MNQTLITLNPLDTIDALKAQHPFTTSVPVYHQRPFLKADHMPLDKLITAIKTNGCWAISHILPHAKLGHPLVLFLDDKPLFVKFDLPAQA